MTEVNEPRTTLLTGATGFLGQEILRVLLDQRPEERIVVLARSSRGYSAAERVKVLLHQLGLAPASDRIVVLESDISQGSRTVGDGLREHVSGRRCRIVHGAASVAFDLPLDEALKINVGGTRVMLDLATEIAASGILERFAYISTAFVAGSRAGTAFENELDVGQSFGNTYEQSKFQAEKLVCSYTDRLPVSVFRPTIIAGNSRSGATTDFKALYWPLKAFASRRVVCIPGDPAACYDIVPVDFVAEALLHILERDDCVGRAYHLAAGQSLTLRRAVELAADYFDVRWIPPFISPAFFYAIQPILYLVLFGRARRILRTGPAFIPYLTRRLSFDNRNTVAALEGSGLKCPDVESYLATLLRFAKETDFGRRSPAAP